MHRTARVFGLLLVAGPALWSDAGGGIAVAVEGIATELGAAGVKDMGRVMRP